MAAEQIDFSQILNSLLSIDNAVRQSAEVSVCFNKNRVGAFFFSLIKNGVNEAKRSNHRVPSVPI